jgi:DNA-binding MarR family transcriptional regulator
VADGAAVATRREAVSPAQRRVKSPHAPQAVSAIDGALTPAQAFVPLLSALGRWTRGSCDRVCARANVMLDNSAIGILDMLSRMGPLRTSDLADLLGLDRSTVSRQVAAVVDAGYVSRAGDKRDGRAALLSLTPLGRSKQQKLASAWQTIAMEFIVDWPEADQANMVGLMGRIVQQIRDGKHG